MKLVFLDGKFSHVSSYSKAGKAFGYDNNEELIQFATTAIELLRSRLADRQWTSQLIRVDVMKDDNEKLKVNEFESLEAMYEATVDDNVRVSNFLTNYWIEKVHIHVIALLGPYNPPVTLRDYDLRGYMQSSRPSYEDEKRGKESRTLKRRVHI